MKPFYILNHNDVRRELATAEEIRSFADGSNASYERLASVELGPDGEFVITPIEGDALQAVILQLDVDQATRFAELLEDILRLFKSARTIGGVSFLIAPLQVRAVDAPFAERLVLDFAEKHRLLTERTSPPLNRKEWHPELKVRLGYRTLVEITWPIAEVNTEKAIDEEVATVAAERATAEGELAELGF